MVVWMDLLSQVINGVVDKDCRWVFVIVAYEETLSVCVQFVKFPVYISQKRTNVEPGSVKVTLIM